MSKCIKTCFGWALAVIGVLFSFIPETCFEWWKAIPCWCDEYNVILVRLIFLAGIYVFCIIAYLIVQKARRKVKISGKNYIIEVKYGDFFQPDKIFKKPNKKVIAFDECFTTKIGSEPHQIKPTSICGQYLQKYLEENVDVKTEVLRSHLTPEVEKSKYNNLDRYESGRVISHGDFLWLAFVKLDQEGLGHWTREEYLKSLEVLWTELDKYYGSTDVCIPILGGGLTRADGWNPNQQELLDTIIASYQLSARKIKKPYKLRIICRRDDVDINMIGGNI